MVLLAPLFARLWLILRNTGFIASFIKITIGLLLECLAFYLLAYIAYRVMNNGSISFIWWIPVYLLLGAGELLVMPIVISNITEKVPEKLKGTFLGLLYLSLSSSAYLSGLIATMAVAFTSERGAAYYYSYLNVAHISALAIIGLGIFCSFTYIYRLMKKN